MRSRNGAQSVPMHRGNFGARRGEFAPPLELPPAAPPHRLQLSRPCEAGSILLRHRAENIMRFAATSKWAG